MYQIYSMGLKELAHSNLFLKSPLVIFVAIHELQNISHHQLNNYNSEDVAIHESCNISQH
jgi:hypothetical protein